MVDGRRLLIFRGEIPVVGSIPTVYAIFCILVKNYCVLTTWSVSALSRLASLYNIAFATNRTTADLIVTSPLTTDEDYVGIVPPVIDRYKNRFNNNNQIVS